MEKLCSNNIISLIQARMSSSRLRGKVLLPLGESNVLGQLIKRAKLFSSKVIVCTSNLESDNPVEQYCDQLNIQCFRGSLQNVFFRFQKALIKYDLNNINWFARLTADNPLTSEELAFLLIQNIENNLDYLSFNKNLIPNGSGIELVNIKTFLNIKNKELDLSEQEHVTLKLYEKSGVYNCRIIDPPKEYRYPEIRLTLDYEDDYTLLKKLLSYKKDININDIINLYKSDKNLFNINKNCIQKKVR